MNYGSLSSSGGDRVAVRVDDGVPVSVNLDRDRNHSRFDDGNDWRLVLTDVRSCSGNKRSSSETVCDVCCSTSS